jgi:beta-N-acetylhexosaminidase
MTRRFATAVALFLAALAVLGPGARAETIEQPGSRLRSEVPDAEVEAWVNETLASLGLEKKVAQLICTDIAGGYLADDDPRMERWLSLARDHGVGMFVLYGGTPRDVAHLLNRLQSAAELPLLMSVDFEGGPGQQVTGASEYPPNMAFAAAGSEELVHRAAVAAGREGRAMGLHLTYTPVVDIAWRPDNPAEAGRSFGGDLDLLGRLVHAYVRGYHESGMLTTAKHFPGRGDVEPVPGKPPWMWNPKSEAAMMAEEMAAFRHGIEAGVDFVMTEHIAIPSLADGSDLPASVEPALATGVLRGRLGFEGILTTDDLWYDHVVARFGAEEVAVRAFLAGHDIILKPKDPVATIAAMVAAVREGRIPEARIDASLRKLLAVKARLGLHRERRVDERRVGEAVGTPEHLALVQEVADRSLTMLRNEGVLPIAADRLGRVVNINVQKADGDPAPAQLSARLAGALPGTRNFTLRPDLDPAVRDTIRDVAAEASLVVLSFFTQRDRAGDPAPVRAADRELIEEIIRARPDAVVAMSYGNPHVIRRIPDVPAFLTGYGERGWYGNQSAYFDSFVRALTGELSPSGRLPIRLSEEYPIGFGLDY